MTFDRLLNGVVLKNTGNTILLVNQEAFNPGESKSIGGNYGEIYQGRIDLAFQLPAVVPVPAINMVEVTQKFYTGRMIKLIP